MFIDDLPGPDALLNFLLQQAVAPPLRRRHKFGRVARHARLFAKEDPRQRGSIREGNNLKRYRLPQLLPAREGLREDLLQPLLIRCASPDYS